MAAITGWVAQAVPSAGTYKERTPHLSVLNKVLSQLHAFAPTANWRSALACSRVFSH